MGRVAVSGQGHIDAKASRSRFGDPQRWGFCFARVRQQQERPALKAGGWGLESLDGHHERVAKTEKRGPAKPVIAGSIPASLSKFELCRYGVIGSHASLRN